jgi:ARG and Rhodanese-Phosphatase-superfamily-associated Protein domain
VQTTINEMIELGDPVEHRGVVIAPLFPRWPARARYLTLEDAIPLGFRVSEVGVFGSVSELLVRNPLEQDVLLYDGEELVGAKQNRILDVTVLVPAGSKQRIPVRYVEEGRWQARKASFSAAGHTAYPELRRRKALARLAERLVCGVTQQVVWGAVREKAAAHGVDSATGAQADIFGARDKELAELRSAFALLQPGQTGALFALGDQLCLDYLSRPDAFARLYPKLLDGYLLDALEHLDRAPTAEKQLAEFVDAVERAVRSRRRGEDMGFLSRGVVGSASDLDGELIQLSAFTSEGSGAPTNLGLAAFCSALSEREEALEAESEPIAVWPIHRAVGEL